MKKYIIFIVLILAIVLSFSCNKDSDVTAVNRITSTIKYTDLTFGGQNGGGSIDGTDKSSGLTNKVGADSLFLSQSPLVEYRYDIAIDTEEIFTYEIEEISGDTLSVSSVINEISRDTVNVTVGDLWLPFDGFNEVDLQLGLKKEFLVDSLEIEIEVNVIDNIPSSQGLLFTSFTIDGVTTATTPSISIDSNNYNISEVIPKYNPNGRVNNYKDGIVIPRFRVRQFYVADDTLTREFELTITSSSGSVVSSIFKIIFVSQQEYTNRQCWLRGEPQCSTLF